jgi:phosphohistidine phosphatase
MKLLYLLRHAKAKPAEGNGADFDRGLASRGRRESPVMAAHMRTRGYLPEAILCSSARRTRETLELLLSRLDHRADTDFDRRLYLATSTDLLRLIQELDDAASSAMVVGHNPGLHQLAIGLAGKGEAAGLHRMREKYPTLALAVLEFAVPRWRAVNWEGGTLVDFMVPAELGPGG